MENIKWMVMMRKIQRPDKKSLKEMIQTRDSARLVHYILRLLVLLIMADQIFKNHLLHRVGK